MPDDVWTPKEVFADLKADLNARLDKQDVVLSRIESRLDNTATKDDVRELHERVDGVHDRVLKIEDERDNLHAVAAARSRVWRRVWVTLTAVGVPLGASLILVYVHP